MTAKRAGLMLGVGGVAGRARNGHFFLGFIGFLSSRLASIFRPFAINFLLPFLFLIRL